MPVETDKARKVLDHASQSVGGFLDAFTAVRREREARGAPTDSDQDLARAALVFAAAGLDSCIKHLIKDACQSLAGTNREVGEKFRKFVAKLVSDESPKRLTEALVADSPKQQLLESYIYELTGSSLQSQDELAKAAGALGIKVPLLSERRGDIVEVFKTRNKIIHELDVQFDAGVGQRQRTSRTKRALEADSKLLLEVGAQFVEQVEAALDEE